MIPRIYRLSRARIAALALAPAALAVGAPAIAQSASALASVQSHLKATSSMTADFVQTDRNGQQLSGKLTLKRPGKIRFQYQKGVPMLIVGDGSRLTMIDYEVRQVQSWPVENSPLGALLDPDRDLSNYARLLQTGNRDVLSVEVKDPKRPEYGTITMVFVRDGAAPSGLRLRGWVALDSQNNRTRTSATRNSTWRLPIRRSAGPIRAPIVAGVEPVFAGRRRCSTGWARFPRPTDVTHRRTANVTAGRPFSFSLATGKTGYSNPRRRQHGSRIWVSPCCPTRAARHLHSRA